MGERESLELNRQGFIGELNGLLDKAKLASTGSLDANQYSEAVDKLEILSDHYTSNRDYFSDAAQEKIEKLLSVIDELLKPTVANQ